MCFIIGNGESRKGFDLNQLKPYGKIFGCNALYRDFSPDYLISVDPDMTDEIFSIPRKFNHIYCCRKKEKNRYRKMIIRYPNGEERILNRTRGMSTGLTAIDFACELEKPNIIFLLGFDLFSDNLLQNNIYKDTKYYAKSKQPATDNVNWIKHMTIIFNENKEKTFYRVGRKQDIISRWKEIKNIYLIDYDEMFMVIDNAKR